MGVPDIYMKIFRYYSVVTLNIGTGLNKPCRPRSDFLSLIRVYIAVYQNLYQLDALINVKILE